MSTSSKSTTSKNTSILKRQRSNSTTKKENPENQQSKENKENENPQNANTNTITKTTTNLELTTNNYDKEYRGKEDLPASNEGILATIREKLSPDITSTNTDVELHDFFNTNSLDYKLKQLVNRSSIMRRLTKNKDVEIVKVIPGINNKLDDLIAFTYIGSLERTTKDDKEQRQQHLSKNIKIQIQKDISRMYKKMEFNKQIFNNVFKDNIDKADDNDFIAADTFYSLLENLYRKNDMEPNYDNINKISLLSIQDFTINLNYLITKKLNILFNPHQVFFVSQILTKQFIEITKQSETFVKHFATQFVITDDSGSFDPENTHGVVDYVFYANLKKNTYGLSIIIKYNNVKFDISNEINNPLNDKFYSTLKNKDRIKGVENYLNPEEEEEDKKSITSGSVKDAFAVGSSVAYIITIPLVLGGLGKNRTKNRKNKNRTKNRKYKNKTKKQTKKQNKNRNKKQKNNKHNSNNITRSKKSKNSTKKLKNKRQK